MCSLLSQSLPQDSIKALQQLQEHMNCQNQLCNTACMDVSPKRRLKTTCRHSCQPQSLSLLSISSIVPAVDFLLHPQISTSLPTHSCNSAGCRAGRCATHLCAPTLEGPVAGWSNNETGFVFGLAGSQHVVVPAGEKAVQFKAQPGNQHSATAIECIGSGGQVLLPLIITKGKLHTVGEQW